ncbi:hypothetical protein [Streptomyces shenzhenensis]|nr:hypothetical protein [Streptomyces shenzhenensis]
MIGTEDRALIDVLTTPRRWTDGGALAAQGLDEAASGDPDID